MSISFFFTTRGFYSDLRSLMFHAFIKTLLSLQNAAVMTRNLVCVTFPLVMKEPHFLNFKQSNIYSIHSDSSDESFKVNNGPTTHTPAIFYPTEPHIKLQTPTFTPEIQKNCTQISNFLPWRSSLLPECACVLHCK